MLTRGEYHPRIAAPGTIAARGRLVPGKYRHAARTQARVHRRSDHTVESMEYDHDKSRRSPLTGGSGIVARGS